MKGWGAIKKGAASVTELGPKLCEVLQEHKRRVGGFCFSVLEEGPAASEVRMNFR